MQQKSIVTTKHRPAVGARVPRKPLASGLTRDDLGVAAANRTALARIIAANSHISVREAKRDVRDFLRVARAVEGGGVAHGKRMRRAEERTASEIADRLVGGIKALVRRFDTVAVTGGLAGKITIKEPPPSPVKKVKPPKKKP